MYEHAQNIDSEIADNNFQPSENLESFFFLLPLSILLFRYKLQIVL